MATLKILKISNFTTKDKVEHVHYTCAYKGRVFGVNTMNIDVESIRLSEIDNTMLTLSGDYEVAKRVVQDLDGPKVYLDLIPKIEFSITDVTNY